MTAKAILPQQSQQQIPITPEHWQSYWKTFGCLRCGLQTSPSDKHGFCVACRDVITSRLRQIIQQSR
jgi:hypothetical protein